MNILFRADSSSTIGTGHIMRDLVLATQYKDDNIIFAVQDLDGDINHKIKESGYKIEILNSNNIKEVKELIKKYNIDMLVIDHYDIDYKYEKKLKKQNKDLKILSFDDTYEKHYCDILLNHNISGDKKKYKGLVPKICELRCGSKYTLLRDEFIMMKKEKKKKEKNIKTIFIAMGGADHSNLNIKILKVLKQFIQKNVKYKNNIKVNLVTTTANQNLKELKNYCKDDSWIQLHINSTKLAKLMKKSDFAIVTPSVTLNEIYFMKIPFIVIKTANNQKDIYAYLKKKRYNTLSQFNKSALLYQIELMINKIKLQNFAALSKFESKKVLKMRNNILVRKWMYSIDKISYKNHSKYLELLKTKKDRVYFLVIKNGQYIGVVNFTNIKKNKKAELGIYSNPSLKGQGNDLMKIILNYGFVILNLKSIRANVFIKNTLAINLYKRFYFKEIKIENDLLHMELKKNNYV
ncbi:MAG: UDP-2,4-diacetamido-2,4,6-trideoxy-beta-L-altropyranose hydrolase [Arcobacteraceae bacterium]|nr:UDP-2,4-diacetamido-2,4,6-trideoxy-beta-L-altropyranose hydrolase [Arcobacteraceae bacterium]